MAGFICVGLFVMFCNPTGEQQATVVNSFCHVYHRVIRSTEEGAALGAAPREVRERIAVNDTLYRCECEHWDNPVCQSQTVRTAAARTAHTARAPAVVRHEVQAHERERLFYDHHQQ